MSPLSEYCPPSVNIVPSRARMRIVICGDLGTSRWENEFVLKQAKVDKQTYVVWSPDSLEKQKEGMVS